MILGLALEKITGEPLNVALRKLVLHAYSSERREFLGIAPSTPFIEDSTFWNPSWTLARGAVQTTDIADMTRTAIGIGSGRLLSARLHRLQNALFAGYAANESYLPSRRVSIAVAMTFKPGGFDAHGDPTPYWRTLWEKIATVLAPRARPIPR